jgi:hypothetical protein
VRARDAASVRHENVCLMVDAAVLDRNKNTHESTPLIDDDSQSAGDAALASCR